MNWEQFQSEKNTAIAESKVVKDHAYYTKKIRDMSIRIDVLHDIKKRSKAETTEYWRLNAECAKLYKLRNELK